MKILKVTSAGSQEVELTAQEEAAFVADLIGTVEQARARKLAELKRRRNSEIESATITVAGNTYACAQEYRELVTNLVSRQSRGKPIVAELRDAQGIGRTLTPVLLGQIEDAMVAKVEELRQRFWARHDAVKAAATVDAVNAITW